ncbi:trihelix transcription factor GTL2 [Vicia villosa]|uniref:trihelix transcription factor GTL2 n=1 Tax=Vicia villosa TaxID=3911 RepID=UPI00273ADE0E|nr:trihelix transcription factor GTL2 [Vicia villosa]
MFDGVPDQFHQFITPRTSSSSLPLHLPFPLSTPPNNNNNNNTFPTFDPYNHQLPLQLQPNNLLHPLHPHNNKDEPKDQTTPPSINNFQIERDQRQILPQLVDPWTNDEVLALLKIRSNMENWFPDFTWEHVSRKLAEVGFKRSAEKCKEKFEEESRFFNNININNNQNQNQNNYGKNFRFVTELEEVYQGGSGGENKRNEVQEKMRSGSNDDDDSRSDEDLVMKKDEDEVFEKSTRNEERKRKRGGDRFEVFKGFCESVVKKMMDQQEEMHNKLIEDMIKRDEEKFSREEAWKKQEMEKMNKELELMAQEQAIAGDRQASIIQFLNKFSSTTNSSAILASLQSFGIGKEDKSKVITPKHFSNSTTLHSQNPNPETHDKTLQPTSENPSSTLPSSSTTLAQPRKYTVGGEKEDIGRRWPKDEVLALINLRCNYNNNEEKEGNNNNTNKAPLWERISQGMLELGYKRSAKRCKEKWENINKYFRKTKDNANRKRSLDSRTCPYFHLLSNLYNQGKLVLQSEKNESNNNMNLPEENVVQEKKAPQDENIGGDGGESSDQVGPACW